MNNTALSNASESKAQTFTSATHKMQGDKMYAAAATYVDTTPSAGTFTAVAATDLITKTAHGMALGLKVRVSNSGGGLPGGLVGATDYYVIPVTADTLKLATSVANANAGTAIDITSAGTGTQTITPTALSMTIKLQTSVDEVKWTDVGTPTAISADADVEWTETEEPHPFIREVLTVTAGQVTLASVIYSK